jgi:hypothetical protein
VNVTVSNETETQAGPQVGQTWKMKDGPPWPDDVIRYRIVNTVEGWVRVQMIASSFCPPRGVRLEQFLANYERDHEYEANA